MAVAQVSSLLLAAILSWLLYLLTVIIYRLFFHPLASFPGPKLAAVTRYYEGYYDVIQNGQYTFKIAELHKKYGIGTPSGPQARANALLVSAVQVLSSESAPMSVARRQHILHKRVQRLRSRLNDMVASRAVVPIGAALSAITADVSTDYTLGKSIDNLGHPEFNYQMINVLQASGAIWRTTKHLRFLGSLTKAVPPSIAAKIGGPDVAAFGDFLRVSCGEPRS